MKEIIFLGDSFDPLNIRAVEAIKVWEAIQYYKTKIAVEDNEMIPPEGEAKIFGSNTVNLEQYGLTWEPLLAEHLDLFCPAVDSFTSPDFDEGKASVVEVLQQALLFVDKYKNDPRFVLFIG